MFMLPTFPTLSDLLCYLSLKVRFDKNQKALLTDKNSKKSLKIKINNFNLW